MDGRMSTHQRRKTRRTIRMTRKMRKKTIKKMTKRNHSTRVVIVNITEVLMEK